jgi:hypothetical protein
VRSDIGSHMPRAECHHCGKYCAITQDGAFRVHRQSGEECPGSRTTAPKLARGVAVDPTTTSPVYDADRDVYINPATGREDEYCRHLRRIEETTL